jgi:glutathione S-transferase
MRLIPEAAPGLKAVAQDGTKFFDDLLKKQGSKFLQGNECMLSDLWLYTVLNFGRTVKQPVNPECKAVAEWMKRVEERASVKAIKG